MRLSTLLGGLLALQALLQVGAADREVSTGAARGSAHSHRPLLRLIRVQRSPARTSPRPQRRKSGSTTSTTSAPETAARIDDDENNPKAVNVDPTSSSSLSSNGAEQYAVVVDCGSSGTRARIFKWPANTPAGELAQRIQPLRSGGGASGEPLSTRIKPGLSSVKDRPDTASDYMAPIMRFVSENVPKDRQADCPVYFLGTAGMRLLSDAQQKSILEDIARDVRKEYNFKKIRAEVITGSEEGAFQWLSINTLAKRMRRQFDQAQDVSFYDQDPATRRYGVIEMGGASAQVTFEASPKLEEGILPYLTVFPDALDAYNKNRIQLGSSQTSSNVSLVSVTFLGFGSEAARGLVVDLLVRESLKSSNKTDSSLDRLKSFVGSIASPFVGGSSAPNMSLEDPCLPQGGEDSMERPVELLSGQSKTIGHRLDRKTFTVKLRGSGDYKQCRRLTNRVIQLVREEKTNCLRREVLGELSCESALIGTSFVPWRQMQFLGLRELYFTTKEMMNLAGRFEGPKVQREAARICATPLESLRRQYASADRIDNKRTLLECFKATWILTWLQNALLMPIDYKTDLVTVERLAESPADELDWTLGALLEKSKGPSRAEVGPGNS